MCWVINLLAFCEGEDGPGSRPKVMMIDELAVLDRAIVRIPGGEAKSTPPVRAAFPEILDKTG